MWGLQPCGVWPVQGAHAWAPERRAPTAPSPRLAHPQCGTNDSTGPKIPEQQTDSRLVAMGVTASGDRGLSNSFPSLLRNSVTILRATEVSPATLVSSVSDCHLH